MNHPQSVCLTSCGTNTSRKLTATHPLIIAKLDCLGPTVTLGCSWWIKEFGRSMPSKMGYISSMEETVSSIDRHSILCCIAQKLIAVSKHYEKRHSEMIRLWYILANYLSEKKEIDFPPPLISVCKLEPLFIVKPKFVNHLLMYRKKEGKQTKDRENKQGTKRSYSHLQPFPNIQLCRRSYCNSQTGKS